jgi:c-di-GMP-binding flagellar brake protein YcgR
MRITKSTDPTAFDSAFRHFNVGTRVQLRAQRDTGSIEHFSSLIGFVKDEFLMVKLPMVRNTPIMFPDDEPIIVRAFTGTTIYSFATVVTRTFLGPLYYMHLAYPREIDRSTLRSELRVRVNMPASVEYTDLSGAKALAQVTLANVSISGAAIGSDALLKVGQQVNLSFPVASDGVERVIRAQAIVRSANRKATGSEEENATFSCGMQFQNLNNEDQLALRLLTYETLLSNRQSIV